MAGDFDLNPIRPSDFKIGINLGLGSGGGRSRAPWRDPLPDDEAASLTHSILRSGASGIASVLGALDKPGQAVRGLIAGKGPRALLNLVPFSDATGLTNERDYTSGRDLTDQYGLTNKGDKGWGAWGVGLAADMATDPLMYATFGAKHALTPIGRGLAKGGLLKGMSREGMLQGFEATHSGLAAAGRTADEIAHMANQGMRIATPEMESAVLKATGKPLEAGQALGGLAGFGLPFASPSAVVGTGKAAQAVARTLDKAGAALKYGNPVGRAWNALMDPAVHGAVDKITQIGMARYGDPAEQALKAEARAHAADVLQSLDPLVKAGTHPETDITGAARTLAQGVSSIRHYDPALVNQVRGVASKINARNDAILAEAQRAGAAVEDAGDAYSKYVHRQMLDVNHGNLQLRQRDGLYPVASGSSIHREDAFRDIPGGDYRINDWFTRFAGLVNQKVPVDTISRAIKKDMVEDLRAGGGVMTKQLGKEFDAKAEALATRIGVASDQYRTQGLPFFSPDLARDEVQRSAQHVRNVTAARAAIGTIGDVARPFVGDGSMMSIPDVLQRIGLRTYKGDQATGKPIEGALVEAYKALAKHGAGPVNPLLTGKVGQLERAAGQWGISNEHADQILKAYGRWVAPEEVKGPLAFMDSLSNTFKALAYPIWIPAHIRNATTATLNNLRSGVSLGDYAAQLGIMRNRATPAALSRYGLGSIDDARKAMFASANIFGGHGVADDVANSAVDALLASGAPGRFTPRAPGVDRVGPTGNLAADAANLVLREGLGSSLAAMGRTAKEVASHPLSPSKWASAISGNLGIKGVGEVAKDTLPAVRAGRIAGTNIEDFFRGAQWLAEVRQGASPSAAADAVNRLHFDYDRLTGFEKSVMRRLVPFYTYARKNLPLQVSTAIHTPAWTLAQAKPFVSQPDSEQGYVPDYLASGLAIPTGPEVDGKRQYISKLGLPAEEAFERLHFNGGLPDIGRTTLDYLGQLNPLIKGPMEQLFDTQFHTQRRLSDLRAPAAATAIGRLFGDDNPQGLAQFLANTPLTRFVTSADKLIDPRKGWLAKAANLLTGVRVTDVDTERQRAIDARTALEGILRGQPHLSRYTSFYVKPEQSQELSPAEVKLMQLYASMQRQARDYAEQRKIQGGPGIGLRL